MALRSITFFRVKAINTSITVGGVTLALQEDLTVNLDGGKCTVVLAKSCGEHTCNAKLSVELAQLLHLDESGAVTLSLALS